MIPARLKAISVAAAAPEDWVIKVESQPIPKAFISLIPLLVKEKIPAPRDAEEILINVKEKINIYKATINPNKFAIFFLFILFFRMINIKFEDY
jgi:hypothetical protein